VPHNQQLERTVIRDRGDARPLNCTFGGYDEVSGVKRLCRIESWVMESRIC
jgi:hypothetical protein